MGEWVKPRKVEGEPRNWICLRVPLFPGEWFVIIANQKGWIRAHKKFNLPHTPEFDAAGARITTIVSGTSNGYFLTLNVPNVTGCKLPVMNLASFLAHEASHMVDYLFESIGEDNPGTETRAYLVDWAVARSMQFFLDRYDFVQDNPDGHG